MMEVFAAFTDQTDYEMGRLLEVVRSLPDADNTLIFYEVGDNGASAEGGLVGLLNENSFFNNVPESLEDNLKHIDELGGPKHFNHFPAGWAWAMNTPFQWTKQIASHLGGVRNPLAVSWPARIKDHGGVRAQFHHVIDIAPTIYEAVGIPFPEMLNGVAQKPIEGVSMVYSFDDAKAPGRRRTQYFEMFINRGIYHDGWWAASRVNIPWEGSAQAGRPRHGDVGALQPGRGFQPGERPGGEEPREAPRAAGPVVDRSRALQRAAARWPQDRAAQRRAAGPPVADRQAHLVHLLSRACWPCRPAARRTCSTSRSRSRPTSRPRPAEPTARSSRSAAATAATALRARRPPRLRRQLSRPLDHARHVRQRRCPAARSKLRGEFNYDGGGMGKGGTMSLFVNGQKVGEGRMEQTQAITLGLGGTLDVGEDTGSAVDDAYTPPFRFNGVIDK